MVALIKEVEDSERNRSSAQTPLPSDGFDSITPEDKQHAPVHLAFAISGVTLNGDTDASVCGTVCLVTDAPDRLRNFLDEIRAAIKREPLVPSAAKALAVTAPLSQLIQNPATRAVVLRVLAVTSFSAYLYYCHKVAFDQLSPEAKVRRMFVDPIFHRLSKKGENFVQVHACSSELHEYVKQAAKKVEETYHRVAELPKVGAPKYATLEELAALIVEASCAHLGNLSDGGAIELFESFRTHIRYAENVETGEKHTRDVNPLR
jgi:hypothetical protein